MAILLSNSPFCCSNASNFSFVDLVTMPAAIAERNPSIAFLLAFVPFRVALVLNRPVCCHCSFLCMVKISNRIDTTEYILFYAELFAKGLSVHNNTSLNISLLFQGQFS